MNEFLVAISGDCIVFVKPVSQRITKEQAINLAAWLVALADDKPGLPEGAFAKKLDEVLQS